ncbi:hypothetical protein [Piscirickettsia litoralis]|uniref:hypothetical protein n=1 Tax=Piscirickettsia litoralis TaxID=1891921 RepID=UPI001F395727|nr:hypothetical protein [Piscirickettsia litoralis]
MMQIIWRLCTFQAGPQAVPYSLRSLRAAFAINFFLQLIWLNSQLSLLHSAMIAFFSASLLLLFPYIVTHSAKYPGRFLQTALALQWVSCVLQALLLLAIFLFQSSLALLSYYLIVSFIWGVGLVQSYY